ncbi:hypothetical protein KAR91_35960 [Candidatus Pacearchaeota archaeon]|nr:hypothetical protein [Candidatus Pacearchaeota archaeon]
MSIESIRTTIKTLLEAVSNIGQVYDYKRYSNEWSSYKELFIKDAKVHVWEIERTGPNAFSVVAHGGDGKVKDTTHNIILRGFYGFNDELATSKTFDTLIDSITDVFIQKPHLTGEAKIVHIPIVGGVQMGFLGDVLCHIAEINLSIEERTFL